MLKETLFRGQTLHFCLLLIYTQQINWLPLNQYTFVLLIRWCRHSCSSLKIAEWCPQSIGKSMKKTMERRKWNIYFKYASSWLGWVWREEVMVPSRPSALNYYFHAYVKIFVGGIRGRERERVSGCATLVPSEKLSNTSLHDVVSTIVETQAPLLYLCICILRKSAVQQSFVDLLTSLIFIRLFVCLFVSTFISIEWCFRPYKPYIFWKLFIWWWQWPRRILTKRQIQRQRHTYTDKDKYKVLPRLNVCYIFQKQGVQGTKILYWL